MCIRQNDPFVSRVELLINSGVKLLNGQLSGGYALDHSQGICAKARENLVDEEEIG